MQFSHYIGVDISKSTLDAAIYASEMKKADTKHVTNVYSHDIDPHSYDVDPLEEGRAFKEQSLFACKQAAL